LGMKDQRVEEEWRKRRVKENDLFGGT
jgi:hypothetical protein